MYASYFGLQHEPFSIAPDPRFLCMTERHREALAHLLYGVQGGGGFVLLTGEIGAGKTTVCRCFLEQVPPRCNVAYIFNPKLSVLELLATVCEEFGITVPAITTRVPTVKDHLDPLNQYLLRSHAVGQTNVLVIDEAQQLSTEVLEQLRLLTNLETHQRKLLQIILIGQPELRSRLARPELEQMAQRVVARYHLGALTEAETATYVRHRLGVAGLAGPVPFDATALQRIYRLADGVPRRINLICDRALLGAYSAGQRQIDRAIVERAAGEVLGPASVAAGPRAAGGPGGAGAARWDRSSRVAAVLGGGAVLAAVGVSAALWWRGQSLEHERLAEARARAVQLADAASTAARSGSAASGAEGAAGRGRTEADAWRELAPPWGLTLAEGDPCAAARRQQALCFRTGSASVPLLRTLDRPGILTLYDANEVPAYALLLGLDAQRATVRLAGVTQTVSLVSLGKLWRGDFATFWRPPTGHEGGIVEPDGGPVSTWLEKQLMAQPGQLPLASWKARVSAFQKAQGLPVDGQAGPTTFMQINRVLGVDEPHLHSGTAAR